MIVLLHKIYKAFNDRHDLIATNPSRWIVAADVLSRIARTPCVRPTGSRYSAAPFRSLASPMGTRLLFTGVHRSQPHAACSLTPFHGEAPRMQ